MWILFVWPIFFCMSFADSSITIITAMIIMIGTLYCEIWLMFKIYMFICRGGYFYDMLLVEDKSNRYKLWVLALHHVIHAILLCYGREWDRYLMEEWAENVHMHNRWGKWENERKRVAISYQIYNIMRVCVLYGYDDDIPKYFHFIVLSFSFAWHAHIFFGWVGCVCLRQ